MPLPPKLQAKLLARFDELIETGESIHKAIECIPGEWKVAWVGREEYRTADRYVVDWSRFVQWRENCASLLDQAVPNGCIHRSSVESFSSLGNKKDQLEYAIAKLKALRDDFAKGFLDDLMHQIEAELVGDYLGQAESLLGEGVSASFDQVPAAVLTGAVLERGLRTICSAQTPPIPAVTADGRPFMLGRLIDDLKAAGVFNELVAKQLRAWADIRNAAAHGEFDKFTRADVETMLAGVKGFLTTYHP